jgi:DNA-binding HxlR family transcriptional regulator
LEIAAIYETLRVFDHRGALEILTALDKEPKRFTALQRSVNMPHATSFQRVVWHLIDHGLVSRTGGADGPQYALTAKGERALPALERFVDALGHWDDPTRSGEPSTQ